VFSRLRTQRVFTPILLLVAALGCFGAVFAIQAIEAKIGPFSEPNVTRTFSPSSNSGRSKAEIRFTTQRPERVTVRIESANGVHVRTIARNKRVDGATIVVWDGRDEDGAVAPDGTYRATLERGGDTRLYSAPGLIELDTRAPQASLVSLRWIDGSLSGSVTSDEDSAVEVLQNGPALAKQRSWKSKRDDDTYRFLATADEDELEDITVIVTDAAGNERRFFVARVKSDGSESVS
jgi:hypothetical protein